MLFFGLTLGLPFHRKPTEKQKKTAEIYVSYYKK